MVKEIWVLFQEGKPQLAFRDEGLARKRAEHKDCKVCHCLLVE